MLKVEYERKRMRMEKYMSLAWSKAMKGLLSGEAEEGRL